MIFMPYIFLNIKYLIWCSSNNLIRKQTKTYMKQSILVNNLMSPFAKLKLLHKSNNKYDVKYSIKIQI
jgi:hypothetical protein